MNIKFAEANGLSKRVCYLERKIKLKKLIIFIIVICTMTLSSVIYAEENDMTRAELANEMMNVYEYITQKFTIPSSEKPIFEDVDKTVPFAIRIEQAYALHFMGGVGDQKFMPNESVSKEQTATVVYRLIQRLNTKYNTELEELKQIEIIDEENIAPWAIDSVNYLLSNGLMQLEEGNFYPYSYVSKDDVSHISEKIKSFYIKPGDNEERIDFETFLSRQYKK